MDITALLTAPKSSQLIENVSFDEYANIPALRSGVVKDGLFLDAERLPVISPRHIKASFEGHIQKEGESLIFGSALHCLLLEPHEFEHRFCCYDGRRDERTKAYQEFLAANVGKTTLKTTGPMSWAWCIEAATELVQNRAVQAYIKEGLRELTGLAPIDGVPCKIRIDWLSLSERCLCDVKTTRAIGPIAFWWEFKKYGYGIQLAMYRHVYELITGEIMPVFIIAVENHPPFCSVVYSVPEELLDRELVLVKRVVAALKKGLETGEWPSFAPEVMALAIPDYEMAVQDFVDWSEE